MEIETALVQCGIPKGEPTGAISTPVYLSSTFRHLGGETTGYDYTRSANPTRAELERAIALLEQGSRGFAFASGMAAISAVLSLFSPGAVVVVSDDLYGGTYRLLEQLYHRYGVRAKYVDTSSAVAVEQALDDPDVAALFVESPSNPTLKISDIRELAELSKLRGVPLIVDNTFMTPYLQHPILLGADLVVHSGTKFLGGHNDSLSGLVVAATEELGEQIAFLQNAVGAVLSPFDCWLLMRGIKTLAVRLDRAQENAAAIAQFLLSHPAVAKVYYPGLPNHPGSAVHRKQSSGAGAMVAFELVQQVDPQAVLAAVRHFNYAESLGGVESLITQPSRQTHADIPAEIRERMGISDRLLRLSVGIENGLDLIADLEQALDAKEVG